MHLLFDKAVFVPLMMWHSVCLTMTMASQDSNRALNRLLLLSSSSQPQAGPGASAGVVPPLPGACNNGTGLLVLHGDHVKPRASHVGPRCCLKSFALCCLAPDARELGRRDTQPAAATVQPELSEVLWKQGQ